MESSSVVSNGWERKSLACIAFCSDSLILRTFESAYIGGRSMCGRESDHVVFASGYKLSSVWSCCVDTLYVLCICMNCWSSCGGPGLAKKASAAHILKTATKTWHNPYILDPYCEPTPQ